MKKFISLLLAAVLTFSLTACGGPELLGKYETDLDMTDLIVSWIDADLGKNLLDVVPENLSAANYIDQFEITLYMEFKKDGTHTQTLDAASIEAAFENIKPALYIYSNHIEKQFFIKLYDPLFGVETDADLEHILGCSWDEYYETNLREMMESTIDQILDGYVQMLTEIDVLNEGNYKAEDGKLYMSFDLSEPIDETVYETYVIDGDVVTVTGGVNGETDDPDMYPYTLTKVSE